MFQITLCPDITDPTFVTFGIAMGHAQPLIADFGYPRTISQVQHGPTTLGINIITITTDTAIQWLTCYKWLLTYPGFTLFWTIIFYLTSTTKLSVLCEWSLRYCFHGITYMKWFSPDLYQIIYLLRSIQVIYYWPMPSLLYFDHILLFTWRQLHMILYGNFIFSHDHFDLFMTIFSKQHWPLLDDNYKWGIIKICNLSTSLVYLVMFQYGILFQVITLTYLLIIYNFPNIIPGFS